MGDLDKVVNIEDYKTRNLAKRAADLYIQYDPIVAALVGIDDENLDKDNYKKYYEKELQKKGINKK